MVFNGFLMVSDDFQINYNGGVLKKCITTKKVEKSLNNCENPLKTH